MNITYGDAVASYTTYAGNKDFDKTLNIETSAPLNAPDALDSVVMLDNLNDTARKLQFIYKMLIGVGVTIKSGDKELVSFQVTEGMKIQDIEYFKQYPGILRFFIDATFGVFLKNLYPLSSESQKAE